MVASDLPSQEQQESLLLDYLPPFPLPRGLARLVAHPAYVEISPSWQLVKTCMRLRQKQVKASAGFHSYDRATK